MSEIVRKSTAVDVLVGPVLDADGVFVTNLTVDAFKVSTNGGDPAALNGSATRTYRHSGLYTLALTAADVATVGRAKITLDSGANAMHPTAIQVVEEAVYDALFVAAATGFATPAQVNAEVLDVLNVDTLVDGGTITAELLAAKKFREADVKVDKTSTPWALVYYERGTETELLRQSLYDVDGNAIAGTTTVIGQAIEPEGG